MDRRPDPLELDRDTRLRDLIADTIASVFADLGGEATPDVLAANVVQALRQTGTGDMTDEKGEPYWPLPANVVASVAGLAENIEALEAATGGYSTKVNARKTGVSLYVRYQRETDVMTSLSFANHMQYGPGYLLTACRTLLAADADR